LVPVDQMTSDHLRESDLLVFGFLLGLLAAGGRGLARAREAGQPDFLIHTLPQDWARPLSWASLGALALKTDASEPLTIELGGQGSRREFITERVEVPPRQRREAGKDFYALTYLHVSRLPDGPVGVHSPVLQQTFLAGPEGWENIWIYGMEVILAGYLTVREFRRRARRLPVGSKVLQYPVTRTENLALPLGELRPLAGLYARVR
ncbi:MAG TPA: hypothetical protein VJ768_09705, partial [Anaerolineales bacterium]|nr:hypothetical protein [Anaerolineales bacterium]